MCSGDPGPHYLPSGLRYTTVLGLVSDPSVVDWRNLRARLAAAQPSETLALLVGELSLGQRVLLVEPVTSSGPTRSTYAAALARQTNEVEDFLLTNPGLSLQAEVDPPAKTSAAAAVTGVLFEKTED
jgi:hypothetical protein